MGRSALHPGLQCTATGVSVHCVRTCSAVRPKRDNGHGISLLMLVTSGGDVSGAVLSGFSLQSVALSEEGF